MIGDQLAIDELLQDCSHSMVRGVSGDASWGIMAWMVERVA